MELYRGRLDGWLAQSTQPDHLVLTQRTNLVKSLQAIIRIRYGPRFTIEPFGSTLYGVSRPTSDLDLTIVCPRRALPCRPS
jgi:DNA polymerase sigma